MKRPQIHLELLLGKCVRDVNGARVGRIEEIEAEHSSDGCIVTSFVLGAAGLLERLSFSGFATVFRSSATARRRARGQKVPWDQMNLSDPHRPRLRCTKAELAKLSGSS